MEPAVRNQLFRIDRALVDLLQERARLLEGLPAEDPGRVTQVDDLLRRTEGPFDSNSLVEVFSAADKGCGGSA